MTLLIIHNNSFLFDFVTSVQGTNNENNINKKAMVSETDSRSSKQLKISTAK